MPVPLPKITVVTPSYNQAHYLETTIQSVLAQDYPNLEWFVVDGGSKDGSVDIIRKYERHFAWWVSERDRNHPHALNKGYERATGEIFCFVNSDDTLEPGVLKYVASQFTEGVDWVVGWAKYFDDKGDEWYFPPKSMRTNLDWLVSNPVPQIASFWRTEAYKKVGGFTEKYLWSFDYEYWVRMWFVGKYRPKFVQRCMGGFRLQPQSKTCSKPENFVTDNAKLIKEYSQYLSPRELAALPREMKRKESRLAQDKAWTALRQGDVKEARKHAMAAWTSGPRFLDTWRVMYCALRGH